MEDQQQRYERARARVQAIKGFYVHASVFVMVNIGLFVINALTSGLGAGYGGFTGRCWAGALALSRMRWRSLVRATGLGTRGKSAKSEELWTTSSSGQGFLGYRDVAQ